MQTKKVYHYIRMPVTEEEQASLERLAASRGTTPGQLLRSLAFDREEEDLKKRTAMGALEHLAEIHAVIMSTLKKDLSGYDMYESDLIALDDRVSDLAREIASLVER